MLQDLIAGPYFTWLNQYGQAGAPRLFASVLYKNNEPTPTTFTTNQPLSSATQYVFKVEVRNTLQSPTWISTTIIVRSAEDTLSVRQFLLASGRPVSTSMATLVGPAKSLHKLLVG